LIQEMLKPKTHICLGLLLIIVLLVVFPMLFQARCLAGTTDSGLVRDHLKKRIESVAGAGSFQALDASYPIDQEFWPDWLKREFDRFNRYR